MDDAKNKKLHSLLDRGCWHELPYRPQYGDTGNCKHCDVLIHFRFWHGELIIEQNPDYCSDLNLVHEVEKTFGDNDSPLMLKYWIALGHVVRKPNPTGGYTTSEVDKVRATASQRVDALIEVLNEQRTK